MPTYKWIQSLSGSGQTSVTFSSVPQTFDDLVIHAYSRAAEGSGSGFEQQLGIRFNGDATQAYNSHGFISSGTPFLFSETSQQSALIRWVPGSSVPANFYAYSTIYIPRYTQTSSGSKMAMVFHMNANDTQQNVSLSQFRWDNGGAISSILFRVGGFQFGSDSQFILYGINNT